MSSLVDNTIGDLLAVPGLRGLLLLDAASAPRMYRLDHDMSGDAIDSLARGISQVVGRLGESAARIELRYAQGRFYIQSLQSGMVVALLTDARPNVPLLSLSLEALVSAAATERDAVLETFRAGELLRLRAMAGRSSLRADAATATRGERASLRATGMAQAPAAATSTSQAPAIDSSFDMSSFRPPVLASPLASRSAVFSTHADLASLLTNISAAAARYLGRSVIANYWRQCQRGAAAELFETRQDGSVSSLEPSARADVAARAAAREWARTFVDRCTLIVVDIRAGVLASIGESGRALLEGDESEGTDDDGVGSLAGVEVV